jgi:signal transduction histidine kinase
MASTGTDVAGIGFDTLSGVKHARAHDTSLGVDRKRIVLLLRSVVIATAAYLLLAGQETGLYQIGFVATFALSNVVLAAAPARFFYMPQFGPALLLVDTAVILFGLSLSQGLSQDLLLVYFFTIFLTTVGESIGQIAIGSALISLVYGYWLWASGGFSLHSDAWVRLPFFFLVAIFYASLIDQLKRERRRREDAEREMQHLRLLLDMAAVFSETHATRDFVRSMGRFVEGACPGLRCRMQLWENDQATAGTDPSPGMAFTVRAHGSEYGELCVEATAGRELTEHERWLCKMVAHAAAGALYAADQSTAAQSATEIKEQFLAVISHEFRTPLHAILGYLEMLDASELGAVDPMVHESIDRLRANACRLQDLLEEVLGFAELRSGRRMVRAERLSFDELISDIAPAIREQLAGKTVTFSYRVLDGADEICTDARKLRRVLACLLSNAAKFTENGWLTLTVGRSLDGSAEITVADTGIGIPSADLAVVFEEFRQVDGSYTRRYGGLGLGLTLARELITILGGQMELDSHVGEGTTVRVRLPQSVIGQNGHQTIVVAAEPDALATSQASENPRYMNLVSHGASENVQ